MPPAMSGLGAFTAEQDAKLEEMIAEKKAEIPSEYHKFYVMAGAGNRSFGITKALGVSADAIAAELKIPVEKAVWFAPVPGKPEGSRTFGEMVSAIGDALETAVGPEISGIINDVINNAAGGLVGGAIAIGTVTDPQFQAEAQAQADAQAAAAEEGIPPVMYAAAAIPAALILL